MSASFGKLALALSLWISGAPALWAQQTPAEWTEDARAHYNQKEYGLARHALEKALAADEKWIAAWHLSGQVATAENQFGEAVKYHRKAAKLEPGNPEHLMFAGFNLNKKGWERSALRSYKKSLAADSLYFESWLLGAGLLEHRKNISESFRWYDHAVKASPLDARAWFARGELYLRLDSLDKASRDNAAALKLDSKNPEVWWQRTRLQLAQGSGIPPIPGTEKVISMDPANGQARIYLAWMKGKFASGDSLVELRLALEKCRDTAETMAWFEICTAFGLTQSGKPEAAREKMKELIKKHPRHPFAWGALWKAENELAMRQPENPGKPVEWPPQHPHYKKSIKLMQKQMTTVWMKYYFGLDKR